MTPPASLQNNKTPVVGRTRRHRPLAKSLEARIYDVLNAAYQKIIIEGILRQRPLPPSKDGRHIPLRARRDDDAAAYTLIDARSDKPYCSNWIRSSRYSLLSFVPKQLWFQFTKIANIYFLALGLLQLLSSFSTTGKWTTIGPLAAFVAFSMAKEAYDDIRRWQMDRSENRSVASVLRTASVAGGPKRASKKRQPRTRHVQKVLSPRADGGDDWVSCLWQDIKVGDVVRLRRDDGVPADLVLLHATGLDAVAYVETMALDGETNLKSKQALPLLATRCDTVDGLRGCQAVVVSEDPNLDLYSFDGRVELGEEVSPLTLHNVLLRGSVLRNTTEAVGLVINTGEECKIRMNANRHVRAKSPALQRLVNRLVLFLILVLLAMAFGLTGGYFLSDAAQRDAWYLTAVPFVDMFFGYVIMFDTLIPLSLYVSLEIIKIFQLFFMSDVEMYDPKTDTPMVANTGTILENLGQVNYVFSDKTGTLTENVMRFRKMTVAGTAFFHPPGEHETTAIKPGASELTTGELVAHIKNDPDSPFSQQASHLLRCMALCHTCLPETRDGSIHYQAASPDERALVEAARDLGHAMVARPANAIVLETTQPGGTVVNESCEVLDVIEFSSARKRMSAIVRLPDGRLCIVSKGADSAIIPRLRQRALANDKAKAVQRRASSRRLQEQSRLSSRMSADLVRRQSSDASRRLSMWSADRRFSGEQSSNNALGHFSFEGDRTIAEEMEMDSLPQPRPTSLELGRFSTDQGAVFEQTFQHTDRFASDGLRILMYAYAYLDEDRYAQWRQRYHEATTSLTNRQERIEAVADEIESDLDLAGVTAIEDKLQDGVPEAIGKLRRAGIKVWMLTGDKRETALTIGHSAQVCTPASEVFVLDATTGRLREDLCSAAKALETGSIPHSVLVVDGHTLAVIEDAEHDGADETTHADGAAAATVTALFYDLVTAVDSVICCRASPAQKAALVTHVKERVPGSMTLAIGDGSNDIGMIQASHVGVGISGREGLQAARIADYSIAQFRFLLRLLLVHGRWNYGRTAKYILATFWKEMAFYLVQAHFQRWTLYTGTSLYEGNSIAVFNVLFTSLPVIFMGILHQDLKPSTLMAFPELYASFGPKNAAFNLRLYLGWMILGILESLALFWMFWATYQYALFDNDNSLYAEGLVTFTVGVIFINVKIL
jgi:phospholipid-translocating ATPase